MILLDVSSLARETMRLNRCISLDYATCTHRTPRVACRRASSSPRLSFGYRADGAVLCSGAECSYVRVEGLRTKVLQVSQHSITTVGENTHVCCGWHRTSFRPLPRDDHQPRNTEINASLRRFDNPQIVYRFCVSTFLKKYNQPPAPAGQEQDARLLKFAIKQVGET